MRLAPSRTSASRSSLSASCSNCSEATILNMRRTSLWTALRPPRLQQPGEYAALLTPPRSTTSGYISSFLDRNLCRSDDDYCYTLNRVVAHAAGGPERFQWLHLAGRVAGPTTQLVLPG